MARGRILSPEFWTDSTIVQLPPYARLLFMGMWNHAYCDQGHLWDDPFDLKLKILPADPVDARELVEALVSAGRVVRGVVNGKPYLAIPTFRRHQKADDPRWARKCPICQTTTEPGSARRSTTEHDGARQLSAQSGVEGNGVEGEGSTRGARPPRYCADHPQGSTGACFACRDAREAQQEWDRAEKVRRVAAPSVRKPRKGDGHTCVPQLPGDEWCFQCGERL